MKHIHILGCGGPAGIGLTRCFKDSFDVTGWDDNPWARKLAECELSEDSDADLIIPLPDSLIARYAGLPKTWLPGARTVEICADKAATARWLGDMCARVEWVRDTQGAGGAGAQMAQELLPGRNLSCELVVSEGVVVAQFTKHRLSYLVKRVEPDVRGIGQSAVSRCIVDKTVTDMATGAVRRVMHSASGVFGVDVKEDEFGAPRVTEINAGRFLTASYVYFYTTGYNLPCLAAELALGLEPSTLAKYPEGVGIIRQIDREPWVGKLHDERLCHAEMPS